MNETWRELKEEQFETSTAHSFMASGGTKGQKGVGIHLHQRWKCAMRTFRPIHEQLCRVDVDAEEKKLALISI